MQIKHNQARATLSYLRGTNSRRKKALNHADQFLAAWGSKTEGLTYDALLDELELLALISAGQDARPAVDNLTDVLAELSLSTRGAVANPTLIALAFDLYRQLVSLIRSSSNMNTVRGQHKELSRRIAHEIEGEITAFHAEALPEEGK